MSTVTVYSLDSFVGDLRRAFADHDDLVGRANSVAEVLEHLLSVGGWVRELIDTKGYGGLPGSTYVDEAYGHPAAGFHVTCGAQKPGAYNSPHDHGAGWVVYGTYEGAIEQTRWGWDYSDRPAQAEARCAGSVRPARGPGRSISSPARRTTRATSPIGLSSYAYQESQKVSTLWRHRYDREQNTARAFLG